MEKPSITFNSTQLPEFYSVVKKRVHHYFTQKKISPFANRAMWVKSVVIILLYVVPWGYLILGDVPSLMVHYVLWGMMGLGMVGIGLSIMHDANHGAYSKNKNVNAFFGGLLNVVGAYHINWKIQHNVFHHTFTNIVGHDEDIGRTIIRFTPKHPYFRAHRFQAFYAVLLYMIFPFVWIFSKDFEQYSRFSKQQLYPRMGRSNRRALAEIILIKLLYWPTTLILPMMVSNWGWEHTLVGFFMHHFISGIILALATQPAHLGDDMEFFTSQDNQGSMENSWAVHQLKTTANFAEKSRFLAWFIGGLNFQIEHHLFPSVCHVHYKDISKIVRATAHEYNLPYKSHVTFWDALKSHFGHLNRLSK